MKNNTKKVRPTNTWTVAMSDTEADYVRQVTNLSEEEFYDTLGMFEEDSTSLFYHVMIEDMDKRRLRNIAANKASLWCNA